jgi:hypothetical protein
MRMTHDGTRLFITMNQTEKVVMFDTSQPVHPKVSRNSGSGSRFRTALSAPD